ncbi:ATP-binding protein [Streptomyces sp. NPDC020917]|uniref:ATP-binding protein n=1 Tax=Streptomyces sp. NPDC020917 TaxID=3365102 RepID=UPI0037898EEA
MNATPTVRMSDVARQWPSSPRAVGQARRQLASFMGEVGLAALSDVATLVLSELMTNALRHGRTTKEDGIATRFVPMDGGMRIEVYDAGQAQPALKRAGGDDESGRGLALVDALTGGRWGVLDGKSNGKAVWALVTPDELDQAAPMLSPSAPPPLAEGFRTTEFVPALLPVCDAGRTLPDHLMAVAGAFDPTDTTEPEDVEHDLRCVLQAHTAGDHHAHVLHLDGHDSGAVWARWDHSSGGNSDDAPITLTVLPDCRVRAPEPLDETCSQYAGHPGGHCYELTNPWRPTTAPATATERPRRL